MMNSVPENKAAFVSRVLMGGFCVDGWGFAVQTGRVFQIADIADQGVGKLQVLEVQGGEYNEQRAGGT